LPSGARAAWSTLFSHVQSGKISAVNVSDLRIRARKRLPKQIFDFIDGGAGDETTLRANRTAFDRVLLRPSQLVDVSRRNLATSVGIDRLSVPVMLGPTGLQRLVHRHGELEAARAAGDAGTVYVISTASGFSMEEIAAVASGPLWFQLYLWRDRDVVKGLVDRAARAGCTALVVTVDTPIVSIRDRDHRNGMTVPPRVTAKTIAEGVRKPRWVREFLMGPPITFGNFKESDIPGLDSSVGIMTYVNKEMTNPAATWSELDWLRDLWPGKLLVKGILSAADAELSLEHGADGVIVSNHGGRQLDGAPATLDVLPAVVAAVGTRGDVLLDGGVRRGSDILKAMALGAKAVLIGRPYWWGLALDGRQGVTDVMGILRRELDLALGLVGRTDVADLDMSAIDASVTGSGIPTFRP
jgi:L-lactate dehydrogenase (cytochrome)